jgi:hypothetical protein
MDAIIVSSPGPEARLAQKCSATDASHVSMKFGHGPGAGGSNVQKCFVLCFNEQLWSLRTIAAIFRRSRQAEK